MNNIYIGVMSGTSMDNIDIVAMTFDPNPTLHATFTTPLPPEYKAKYLKIINAGTCNLQELGELDTWTGEIFAAAIQQFLTAKNLDRTQITAIGSHGQTIWHAPTAQYPFSMQIGDPNVIAERTGITTVGDFRRADLAAGGRGAPFAPAFHQAVFANNNEARCIVNIGGMSNVSILEHTRYIGFDPGPGNVLLDYWTTQHFNQPYDKDGELGRTGKLVRELLDLCLAEPYFKQTPPKSTGRELFNAKWLQEKLTLCSVVPSPIDVLTTLTHLTACTITDAIKNYAQPSCKVFVCGGGAYNQTLLSTLSILLEQEVATTSALGIDPDWVEAALFAWLAKQRMSEQTVKLTTGARHPAVLGGVYLAHEHNPA